MVTPEAIGTLVVFIVSIFFVIQSVHIPVLLPRFGWRKIPVNLTTAPIVAIAILWASRCLGPAVIRNGIVGTEGVKPYNILILFFSLAYMAITLDVTGILQSAAYWVSNKGGASGWKLFFYFYVMLTLLSVLLGNDPVILSGTAFLVYYTQVVEVQHLPWIMSEFAAANTASMVLFVGNPTNVVICEGFGVNNAAFTAYTIFPFLACNIACFIALAIQFRNRIPRQITPTQLDPRSVLLDPVSAWVGSILLGTCLVVIIVVSFFKVDVWMISLPFAVAKFIFDLTWDPYKLHKRGRQQADLKEKQPSEKQTSPSPTLFSNTSRTVLRAQREGTQSTLQNQRQGTQSTLQSQRQSTYGTLTNGDATHEMVAEIKDLPSHPKHILPQYPVSEPPFLPASSLEQVTSSPKPSLDPVSPPQRLVQIVEPSASDTAAGNADSRSRSPSPLPSFRDRRLEWLEAHFPTIYKAFPRLPFALVPFAFSQFILIEALSHQGWIDVFATWLVRASKFQIYPTIWLIGVLGVIMCNISGTNIGATILLTKVVRAANMPNHTLRAAAIALAVASNIGAVSFTFSASLAGLLWRSILEQKKIHVMQREFAKWNLLPILVMTAVGLSVVSVEMAVLYGGKVS